VTKWFHKLARFQLLLIRASVKEPTQPPKPGSLSNHKLELFLNVDV